MWKLIAKGIIWILSHAEVELERGGRKSANIKFKRAI